MLNWSDKDATGKPLTDGRICAIVTNEEDPSMPPIVTYGKDKDEVLQKMAHTIATGQLTIHKLRSTTPAAPVRTAAPATGAPTPTEISQATTDLQNPIKAPQAVKTLLRAVGVDVDRDAQIRIANQVAAVAKQWEIDNPDYPKDPRNDRMLIDRATVIAGGSFLKITAEVLTRAYQQLVREKVFHEPAAAGTAVHPSGNPDSRTEPTHIDTSYRRNALRSTEPAPIREDTKQVKEWRQIAEKGNSRELRHYIERVPGFSDWFEKEYARKSA